MRFEPDRGGELRVLRQLREAGFECLLVRGRELQRQVRDAWLEIQLL